MGSNASTKTRFIFSVMTAVLVALLHGTVLIAQDARSNEDRVPGSALSNKTFRSEGTPVAGGAEIITIFARKEGPDGDLPLVSVLRDTLGDTKAENDRLRYIWVHSYTRPSFKQKVASYMPFLYTRTGNKVATGKSPPPPVIDITRPAGSGVWDTVFWQVFRKVLLADAGHFVKAGALQYRENKENYRSTAIATALAVLSIYEYSSGERVLSDQELHDIQARLSLNNKLLGPHMQPENLARAYGKRVETELKYRSQNWELLRQACEKQGLVFQPLAMPDGTARSAVVWLREEDLAIRADHRWDGRFLNIKNPWTDKDLASWKGYREERWYDADDRQAATEAAGTTKFTLIPLAIYGLDNQKIPTILVDFRSRSNTKVREMSRRVITDAVNDFATVFQIDGMPAFFGKWVLDFVTARRGVDIDQRSRVAAYADLKLLLELDESLDPEFKNIVGDKIENATLNPLQNDADAEERLARQQYANLMRWAVDENGLAAKINKDRREEMLRLKHTQLPVRIGFSLAHFVTLGAYTHRETPTPELLAELDLRRQLDHHERVVREIAAMTNDPAIDSNMDLLKYALEFIASSGKEATGKTAKALTTVFKASDDEDVRSLCIAGLYKINSETAKRELLAIYQDRQQPQRVRSETARYLKLAAEEGQRMSKLDARTVAAIPAIN